MLTYSFAALFGAFASAAAGVICSYLCNYRFNNPATWVFYTSITNFVFLPFLFLFGSITIPPTQVWPAYLLLSILMVIPLFPIYLAYKENDASIVNSLLSLGKIMLPLFALAFLGEKLAPIQYIGFFIIIATNIILNLKPKQKIKLNAAFYYMLICSLLLTFNLVVEKYVLIYDSNWINLIFYVFLLSVILSFLFLLVPNVRKDVKANIPLFRKSFKAFTAAELLSFIGHSCGIFALAGLPVIPKSALSSAEPIFVLLINMILVYKFHMVVKEKVSRSYTIKKIIGYIFLTLGIIMTVGN